MIAGRFVCREPRGERHSVVATCLCPRSDRTANTDSPDAAGTDAKECRRSWNLSPFSFAA